MKADESFPIEIGSKQGWSLVSKPILKWESKGKYPVVLHRLIPESIVSRETAKFRNGIFKTVQSQEQYFYNIFNTCGGLKPHFLIRESSYMLTIASAYSIYWNQIVSVKNTDRIDNSLLTSIYDNVSYGHGNLLVLSKGKDIEHASDLLNDAVLLVNDDTKADERKKREGGIDALHSMALDSKSKHLKIPVVVSSCAAAQMRPDLYVDFSELDGNYSISSAALTELLEWHDAKMIAEIEKKYYDFTEIFNRNIEEISTQTPYFIPAQRMNVYYILISTLRTYDEYFGEFFGDETERYIIDILGKYNEVGTSFDDMLLTIFGKYLNQEISSGRFQWIKRTKYIVFDESTNSAIFDDDYIYIETDILKELVKIKLNLHSVNSLTGILNVNDCLAINDKNSKCYRFHVQNSNGEPYMLYTYGISKTLINAENRKRLALSDYGRFLLDYIELEQSEILPLGITSDGNYVGKDISYRNKSNDSLFITGQSGKGKTFCITNLLPSFAMLDSRIAVFDVSSSFTRDEVLRALTEEVVDTLFEFVEIDVGKFMLPVNPLFIGDCIGIPAKKRRIVGFIKAAAGKLGKDDTRTITGIVSDMLKKNSSITSVSIKLLRDTLKNGGKIGILVYNLISSLLDDIEMIGFEEQGWSEFFESTKKIPVISFGNESGDNVHSLLDTMIASAFEWQRDHNTAPMTLVIDEIKDQNFLEGSPLHTILTQGRKFNTKLIGLTQQYISQGSHAIDVMKEAGIKIFFKPAKSLDKIAVELGYKSPVDAGFGSMGQGDFILSSDLYNKLDGVNEPIVIHCKTIKFVETPLYEKFKKEFNIK